MRSESSQSSIISSVDFLRNFCLVSFYLDLTQYLKNRFDHLRFSPVSRFDNCLKHKIRLVTQVLTKLVTDIGHVTVVNIPVHADRIPFNSRKDLRRLNWAKNGYENYFHFWTLKFFLRSHWFFFMKFSAKASFHTFF